MMFGVRTKRMVQFALIAIAAGEVSAAAAEVLVLRATGPRAPRHYAVGTRHADAAVFELRPGDAMTVLTRTGTRQWRGPGYYSLVEPARPLVLANGQRVRVQTGVIRQIAPTPGVMPTDILEYDATREGRMCVAQGGQPLLWRPRGARGARVTISRIGNAPRTVDWRAGEISVGWPSAMPLADGATYIITNSANRRPVRVTMALMPPIDMADPDRLATRLLERGCTAQLETLIATRADRSAPVLPDRGRRIGAGR